MIIKRFKNNKAPGEDGIQGITLKNLPTNIIEVIVDIINSSIRKRHFPHNWKNSIIIPIEKSGKIKTDPTSYRPISLLPILSKVYETVSQNRIEQTNITTRYPKRTIWLQKETFHHTPAHKTSTGDCHWIYEGTTQYPL